MKLSVIIPTLNERDNIARVIEQVRSAHETIVVDGGSSDGTVEAARAAGARVIEQPASRGGQQNAGARAAGGDTLLFLHADTILSGDFEARIASALSRPGVSAGAFRFELDEPGFGMWLVETIVACRCRLFQLPFGDQGLFVRKETFFAAGGFPDEPIMEDYELVCRLRTLGRIEMVESPAITSARRWRKLGVLRTTWSNQVCLLAYKLNVAPERIARWRSAS